MRSIWWDFYLFLVLEKCGEGGEGYSSVLRFD